jgi:hypothetical protein
MRPWDLSLSRWRCKTQLIEKDHIYHECDQENCYQVITVSSAILEKA